MDFANAQEVREALHSLKGKGSWKSTVAFQTLFVAPLASQL